TCPVLSRCRLAAPACRGAGESPPSFSAVKLSLEQQIGSATRALDDARRMAHRDPARLGELVEFINVLAELRQQEGAFARAESLYREALFRIQETKSADPRLLVGVHSLLAHLY